MSVSTLFASLLLTTLPLIGGCKRLFPAGSDAATSGQSGEVRQLELPCGSNGASPAAGQWEFTGGRNQPFQVTAKWCFPARSQGRLKVVLIVDASGSMIYNDPLYGASCGRLQAAKVLLDDLARNLAAGDTVEVGAVRFADSAERISGMVPLTQFQSTALTSENFCAASGFTNYAAAFRETQALVGDAGQTGATPAVAYFISDGQPTADLPETDPGQPYESGLREANALRPKVKALNVVFLEPQAALPQVMRPPTDVRPYLDQIAGDPKRVALVGNAQAIAAQLTQFPLPAIGLESVGSAKLVVEGQESVIEIERIVEEAAGTGRWEIRTKPFTLKGSEGRQIDNKIILKGKRQSGSEVEASGVMKFRALY